MRSAHTPLLNKNLADALAGCAERPFEHARALPADAYRSEDMLAAEIETIFKREWFCAGRGDSLAQAGDYTAFHIADTPVFVIRGRDGKMRAFSNVCLHRMSQLVKETGNCQAVVCPYHAWSYGLDGVLRNAPYMEENTPTFDHDGYRLPEFRCEEWEGWVYVSLNPDAPALSGHLAELSEIVTGRYRLGDYRETFREEHLWNTNWKVLAENFMESYHLFRLHAATIGPHSKVSEMEFPEGRPAFNYHWITKEDSLPLGLAHKNNTYLKDEWRRTTALITIYPSHLITLTPGYFWYLSLSPESPGKVRIIYGGGFAPDYVNDPDFENIAAGAKAFLDTTNEEDRVGVETVYKGILSPYAGSGQLNLLERPVYDFGRYITGRVLGGGRPARAVQTDSKSA